MRTHDSWAADGWFKAKASNSNGTGCVEVNFSPTGWFKANASESNGTGCVEVNFGGAGLIALRDSKNPQGGVFAFGTTEWRAFLGLATRSASS